MKHVKATVAVVALSIAAAVPSAISAAEKPLNPKAISIKLPDQIPWKRNAAGTAEVAILYGEPSKPGLYVEMQKWLPGNMSRPHWHPNDRAITVLKGTWWVGTGEPFDPDTTTPLPTGSFCIVIEIVAPERRGNGYTTRHLHCAFPDLPPKVGFAKTVTMRAKDPITLGGEGYMQKRLDYLDYVASQPNPSWMVIQDLDDPAGYGAFWGAAQSNVHKALGCQGVVTNGCVRDIPTIAACFQLLAGSIAPSHAFVHVVDFGGEVTVHGMAVKSGDLTWSAVSSWPSANVAPAPAPRMALSPA